MGDSPQRGETHRTTIEIAGPVNTKKFEMFKKELGAALAKCAGKKGKIREITLEKTNK